MTHVGKNAVVEAILFQKCSVHVIIYKVYRERCTTRLKNPLRRSPSIDSVDRRELKKEHKEEEERKENHKEEEGELKKEEERKE